jgi:hypothetical protein
MFFIAILGWYITFVMMAVEMRLSVEISVGDLSYFWLGTDVDLADLEKKD